jgi:(p)ppGpp synthase/HD superfamily hydrolase
MDSSVPARSFAYSPRLDRALALAAIAHAGQARKGTSVPYVTHPFHVGMILQRHGFPEDFVVAAVLHDVLEDIKPERPGMRDALADTFPEMAQAHDAPAEFMATLERFLEEEFSGEVMALVRGVTDTKEVDGRRLSTREKRALKLAELRGPETSAGILALKSADAIHNARSITNDLRARGLAVMARFRTGPSATLKWHEDILEAAQPRLAAEHPGLVAELRDAVTTLGRELAGQLAQAHDDVRRELEALDR